MAAGTIADLFFAYRQGDHNARQELMARVGMGILAAPGPE